MKKKGHKTLTLGKRLASACLPYILVVGSKKEGMMLPTIIMAAHTMLLKKYTYYVYMCVYCIKKTIVASIISRVRVCFFLESIFGKEVFAGFP